MREDPSARLCACNREGAVFLDATTVDPIHWSMTMSRGKLNPDKRRPVVSATTYERMNPGSRNTRSLPSGESPGPFSLVLTPFSLVLTTNVGAPPLTEMRWMLPSIRELE